MGQGSACSTFLSSTKSNCQDEVGTARLSLNQISSTGAEMEGKQVPGPSPAPLSPGHPLTLSPCRNVLWLPALLWPQLPDSPWG